MQSKDTDIVPTLCRRSTSRRSTQPFEKRSKLSFLQQSYYSWDTFWVGRLAEPRISSPF